jgi:microsomal dipeptidase-like Zn-dependent dipeptidase/gamma-glutamyl-gamma-aminobutyrate hydrolase PuuD
MTTEFDWKDAYRQFHKSFPGYRRQPVIGITGNFGEKGCELAEGYYRSVQEAGATPVIIPPIEDRDVLIDTLSHIDGLLLSGGGDLNPLFMDEEPVPALRGINPRRDKAELLMVRLAFDRQIPILGICRGIQVLAAALDGRVYQDLETEIQNVGLIKHSQDLPREYASHTVTLTEDSLLRSIMAADTLVVNSFHHQAVCNPGPHLRVSAISCDGVIEAVESTEYKSILGVQWHPECFILRGDRCMMPLFEWLADEARNYRQARNVHHHLLTLDSHCDTPMFFYEEGDAPTSQNAQMFRQRTDRVLVDLHKMTEGGLDASIMVAYLKQGERDIESHLAATAKADRILTQIENMVAANSTAVDLAYTPQDLYRLKAEGKRAIMMGIENGYAIGEDIRQVEHFRKRGVVYMTLCHNGDNDICDSARGLGEHNGVSDFGVQVIKEMNRTGMMVDLSHASEKSFYDALEISKTPIVCSHSSSRALCPHPRNLTDDQLRALAKAGGVAQVTFYNGFLRADEHATILDAVEHLNHMVNVMGIEHVGIGTDFDGDGGVPGLASASELVNFTRRLLRERYSIEDLRLIWGGNFLRVMETVQQQGDTIVGR